MKNPSPQIRILGHSEVLAYKLLAIIDFDTGFFKINESFPTVTSLGLEVGTKILYLRHYNSPRL